MQNIKFVVKFCEIVLPFPKPYRLFIVQYYSVISFASLVPSAPRLGVPPAARPPRVTGPIQLPRRREVAVRHQLHLPTRGLVQSRDFFRRKQEDSSRILCYFRTIVSEKCQNFEPGTRIFFCKIRSHGEPWNLHAKQEG